MSLPLALLAGGLATRLQPLTEKFPKALIEINGIPFLSHQLHLLSAAGINKVVICAWYRGEMIQEFAGNGSEFGLDICYSFDGDSLLGTGGAIKNALPLLGDVFFVLYGDSYLPCDYQSVEKAFFKSTKDGLMTVFHNRDAGDKSNVLFADGRIIRYDKKIHSAEMEHIDYGLGVFRSNVFRDYPSGQAFDLAEVYQHLINEERLAGHEVFDRFYEIGSFSGIRDLENYLKHASGEKNCE